MTKTIFGIAAPKKECTDKKCPFHGQIDVKERLFGAKVIKRDTNRSATVEWLRPYYVPKYERYEMRRSRIRVHNPMCVDARIGEQVLIGQTRPLSKTKTHVIVQVGVETLDANSSSQVKTKEKKASSKKNDAAKV